MTYALIASDSPSVAAEVLSVLPSPEFHVDAVDSGEALLAAARTRQPDVVVLDFQIGNRGGMATCLDLHLEQSAGRLNSIPVLLLLDRRADVFLAKRANAEGWVLKPLDPIRLRKAITSLLAGETYYDSTDLPVG